MDKLDFFSNKFLVLDTSTLIDYPEFILDIKNVNIIIPFEILEELDQLKHKRGPASKAARQANRVLDGLRKLGDLKAGVFTDLGTNIIVVDNADTSILPKCIGDNQDARILSVAKQSFDVYQDSVLVSQDIAMRVKADAIGLPCKSLVECIDESEFCDKKYSGYTKIELADEIISKLYTEDLIDPYEYNLENEYPPNHFLLLKGLNSSALIKVWSDGVWRKLMFSSGKKFHVQGIRPRNKEQTFALDLLLDPTISMVTVTGIAGCGKTLLAIASAMEELSNGNYDKILLTRPAESTSREIGFLPGDKKEKMMPWLQPIFDNLNFIVGKKGGGYIEMMINKGVIEVESLSYIRGRSLHGTYVIIDEAQNINQSEAKALITRVADNSKIVLLGDLDQIDSFELSRGTSGLAKIVDQFKNFDRSGHITMKKGERSLLATYAAENM